MNATTAPAAGQISFPKDVVNAIQGDIAQAHLALHGLAQLLVVDGALPDSSCVAHILSYVERGLQRADDLISPFNKMGE